MKGASAVLAVLALAFVIAGAPAHAQTTPVAPVRRPLVLGSTGDGLVLRMPNAYAPETCLRTPGRGDVCIARRVPSRRLARHLLVQGSLLTVTGILGVGIARVIDRYCSPEDVGKCSPVASGSWIGITTVGVLGAGLVIVGGLQQGRYRRGRDELLRLRGAVVPWIDRGSAGVEVIGTF